MVVTREALSHFSLPLSQKLGSTGRSRKRKQKQDEKQKQKQT
jgi:hypothetical protein